MSGVSRLLERERELGELRAAAAAAAAGRGSTVLVLGEAGIGKTALLQAFVADLDPGTRLIVGACEDLVTPRALGPLRDAAARIGGPLAEALSAGADPQRIFPVLTALLAEGPAVLVVEDAHWADGATLDVLRHFSKRMPELPAMLVVSYRENDLGRDHPLRSVLGGLPASASRRLPLAPLTADAVAHLADGTRMDPDELYDLTAGNPFYVTEVLASPDDLVTPTVVDAVLARVSLLSPAARSTLDRLAVIPGGIDLGLLRQLVPDLGPVSEAEQAGVLSLRSNRVTFRHELARRAVAGTLSPLERLTLNADVLAALLARPDPDPFRVLHHAVEAGDDEMVVRHGPVAAVEATRVGAHRQAASCYAQILARDALLGPVDRAAFHEANAWALSNSNQLHAAADAADTAVRLWRDVGDTSRLIHALVTSSRQQWLTEQSMAAHRSAEWALTLASETGETAEHALALLNLGGLLVLIDREWEGLPLLDEAMAMAERIRDADIAALCHNYRGSAMLQLGDLAGAPTCCSAWNSPATSATTSTCCAATTTSPRGSGGWATSTGPCTSSRRPRSTAGTGSSPSTRTCSTPAGTG